MGKVIDYNIDENNLYSYAKAAFKQGNYLLCVQNINEGLQLSDLSFEMRSSFYELLIFVYENTENNAAKTDIIIKNAPEVDGDYARIDFKEFVQIEETYFEGEFEEEEYGELYSYSQIRDFFITKDYTSAFAKLLTTDLGQKYLQKLTEYICLAYEEDKTFNINDYFVPTISLLAKLDDKNRLVSVMLASGGACRDLAVDGANVFSEDIDDLVKLLGLAEVYYINSELDIAKGLYKKALSYSPFNEDALFHMAAILYAKGDTKEAGKFFAKYKAMFKNTFLPIGMYESYFESGYIKTTPVLYPFLDVNFVDEISREVIERIQTYGLNGATLKDIAEVISTCETEADCLLLPLLPNILKKDKMQSVILYLLPNPAINNTIKEKLLASLFDIGYQGRYVAFLNNKLVFATMVSLGEKSSDFYKEIYRQFVLEMPFAKINMPLKCNVLKNAIVKVENVIPNPESIDARYVSYMVLKNYSKMSKILIEWEEVEQSLRMDRLYVPKFFEKYRLNKWIIK